MDGRRLRTMEEVLRLPTHRTNTAARPQSERRLFPVRVSA